MTFNGKRFLVTGGFGMVGSHIADQLLDAGVAEVILFDNGSVGQSSSVSHLRGNPRVRFVTGDILRLTQVYDALEGVEGVFHAAFFITLPLSRNIWAGMDVNVRGTMNVLEAARMRGVGKVVYSSSISTYGNASGQHIDETSAYDGNGVQPAAGLYGTSKILGEHLCRFYEAEYGLRFTVLRISTVYGDRQHYRGINSVPIIDAFRSALKGEPPVLGITAEDEHDYIYVGDVARAQLIAMQNPESGAVVNIVSGSSVSNRELVETALRVCGSDAAPVFRPDAGGQKTAAMLNTRFENKRARELLNWQPEISLETGIGRLFNWYKETQT